ncbi:MAG: ATP-dependent helicase HrpB [Spirochaetia bacterium]|nr:ATP-dependent helicase HrpB [Spirochaetia bacterium]
MKQSLPIDAVLPEISSILSARNIAVLEAAPGAGKTTGVPPFLLEEPWLNGKTMLMLEPRRIAARSAAARIASQMNEKVGETVGYAIRFDRKTSTRTRIEVVTEGILVRRMQDDPELTGVGLLLFDEFHERSIHTDLGLALALDIQESIRPDLRILVMSATLDGDRIASFLGNAPVIRSEGRAHHVTVAYAGRSQLFPAQECARAIAQVIPTHEGDVLAFLPGGGDIRKARSILEEKLPSDVVIHALYGDLTQKDQDAAIAPDPRGRRRIILATNIAETSLTIEGVRIVVDSGLAKYMQHDPRTGMSRLETGPISKASAVQRAGRAGRTAPGHCLRLYDEEEFRRFSPFTEPEVIQADLAPLLLELAAWGTAPDRLRFLDPLPYAHVQSAYSLLSMLEMLDEHRRITSYGRIAAGIPLHPRLARMTYESPGSLSKAACNLGALLSERDIFRASPGNRIPSDIRERLRLLADADQHSAPGLAFGTTLDRFALDRVRRIAQEISRIGSREKPRNSDDAARSAPRNSEIRATSEAGLLALAYPDRIAAIRPGSRERYLLSNGRGALLDKTDQLCGQEFLVIADLDGAGADAKVRMAMPISAEEIRELFAEQIQTLETTELDEKTGRILAFRSDVLGSITLSRKQIEIDSSNSDAVLLRSIEKAGIDSLDWNEEVVQFCMRSEMLRKLGFELPELSREWLTKNLSDWLSPHLVGISRLSDVQKLKLKDVFQAMLDYKQLKTLQTQAPELMPVPSGSNIRLEYSENDVIMAVKLQEMFGQKETPRIANGRVAVTLHLLSPGMKPVQVTRDLEGFWKKTYAEVRKELRGRYPRHPWPDDPTTATPTKFAKRRGT